MPFQTGHPRYGGRTKGTPNKRTSQFQDLLTSYGVEPLGELLKLLPSLAPEKRVDVLKDLLKFVYPTLKSAEIEVETFSANPAEQPTFEEYKELVKRARGETAIPDEKLREVYEIRFGSSGHS